jgi:hypothetical protein
MGRLQDFDNDSVTCDRVGCGKHELVGGGQVPDLWLRGSIVDATIATYDACSVHCASAIAKQVAHDPKAEYRMTWWSSTGESVETTVGPQGWTMKRIR